MKQKTYKIPNAPEGHPELPVYRLLDGREVVILPFSTNAGDVRAMEIRAGSHGWLLWISPSSLTPVYLPWPEDGDLVVLLSDGGLDAICRISAGGKRIRNTCNRGAYAPANCRIFLPPKGHVLTGENLTREWLEANAKEWEVI